MEESLPRTRSARQTPVMQAGLVISGLADIWEMWSFQDSLDFFETFVKEMWDDENTSGENQFKELKKIEEMTDWHGEPFVAGFKAAIVQIATLQVACAFAIEAFKAKKNSTVAWAFACEANHWLGILQGTISGRSMQKEVSATVFANAGADKRHAENRAMKASVIAWCDENISKYKSLDKAAEAIAGKEMPVSFRTARNWIGEWKKLRSTGKL